MKALFLLSSVDCKKGDIISERVQLERCCRVSRDIMRSERMVAVVVARLLSSVLSLRLFFRLFMMSTQYLQILDLLFQLFPDIS